MGDKVLPGQKFNPTARLHNRFVDTNEWVELQRLRGLGEREDEIRNPVRVKARNGFGVAIRQFEIMEIERVSIKPDTTDERKWAFRHNPTLVGIKPTEKDLSTILVAQNAADRNEYVQCIIAGLTPVKANIVDKTHTCLTNTNDESKFLTSTAVSGISMVWPRPPTSTGEQLVLANLGSPRSQLVIFEATSEITGRASTLLGFGNAKFWPIEKSNRQLQGSGTSSEILNWGESTIPSGTLGVAARDVFGNLIIVAAEC